MQANHVLSAAAAIALLTSTSAVLAQSDTKEGAPGQQMQNPATEPKAEGPGASGYAPGRQERIPDGKGASESAPGQNGVTVVPKTGGNRDTTGSTRDRKR